MGFIARHKANLTRAYGDARASIYNTAACVLTIVFMLAGVELLYAVLQDFSMLTNDTAFVIAGVVLVVLCGVGSVVLAGRAATIQDSVDDARAEEEAAAGERARKKAEAKAKLAAAGGNKSKKRKKRH